MIRASAGTYPISAQCRALGVPRSTYYWRLSHPPAKCDPDPITKDVVQIYEKSWGRYGTPRIKQMLARRGICASRRRIGRIMHENGLVSAYSQGKPRDAGSGVNEAKLPNIVAREFDGRQPRTHIVGDLTFVKVGRRWCYVCLLVDLYNREIVGHAASQRKDSSLVKAALATLDFPLSSIEVLHTDRGAEFDNAAIDELLDEFNIKRSLSKKGCPWDNAVIESTNRILKKELVYRHRWWSLDQLRSELNRYVRWYNRERIHSKLGYLSPVEFRQAGHMLQPAHKTRGTAPATPVASAAPTTR